MTKLTKIELVQANTALSAEVEALRVQCAQLTAQVEMLQRKALPQPEVRNVSMSAYRQACAAAEAMAMKTGRCVRVG